MADGGDLTRLAGIPVELWREGMELWRSGSSMAQVCRHVGYPSTTHVYGLIKKTPWLFALYEDGPRRQRQSAPKRGARPLTEADWAAALAAYRSGKPLKEVCSGVGSAPSVKQWERRWRTNAGFRRLVEEIRFALSLSRAEAKKERRRERWRSASLASAAARSGAPLLKGVLLQNHIYGVMSACVPLHWPEHVRDDVISMMVLETLEGEIEAEPEQARKALPAVLRRYNVQMGKWRERDRALYLFEVEQEAAEAAEASAEAILEAADMALALDKAKRGRAWRRDQNLQDAPSDEDDGQKAKDDPFRCKHISSKKFQYVRFDGCDD